MIHGGHSFQDLKELLLTSLCRCLQGPVESMPRQVRADVAGGGGSL